MNAWFRIGAALILAAALAGCAVEEVWAPDDAIRAATFSSSGPPTVSLITMISNSNGSGGHSALMIDGAQRVVFDPAGSWHHPQVPERNDVLYGLSPPLLDFYYDYHARETYHVVVQDVQVTPAVAAALTQRVQGYGAVPQAQCSLSISRVLSQTPGFESVGTSWFPARTMERFADIPGVRSRQIFDDDSDDNLELLQAQARAARNAEIAEGIVGN